jgi:hypothetical protein
MVYGKRVLVNEKNINFENLKNLFENNRRHFVVKIIKKESKNNREYYKIYIIKELP